MGNQRANQIRGSQIGRIAPWSTQSIPGTHNFDFSPPAIIVADVPNKHAVRARGAPTDGEILGIDGPISIDVDRLHRLTRHVGDEDAAAVTGVVDVVNAI